MHLSLVRILLLSATVIICASSKSNQPRAEEERQFELNLRRIGDDLLKTLGDSTTRVLPIEESDGMYQLSFASNLSFNPEDVLQSVDKVLSKEAYTGPFLFEVQECLTGNVVHSFQWYQNVNKETIACKSRALPEDCYQLIVTFGQQTESSLSNYPIYLMLSVLIVLLSMLGYYLQKQKKKVSDDGDIIPLGEYRFDKRNTNLIHRDKKIELTGKEAELLVLLYDAANTTVEREVILNMVWGDQGDYVGRTLDVFISKLRKKLEADDKVKIVNIRGVGYKLVTNA